MVGRARDLSRVLDDFLENTEEEPGSNDGFWEQRFARIKQVASGYLSESEKLPILREALNDLHPTVRYAAVTALRKMDNPGVADALIYALADSDEWVRIRAIEGLGEKKARTAIEYFVKYLDEEPNPKVRATLVKHLGVFQEDRLIPIIGAYLNDVDARVRANAVEGLGFYAPEKVVSLLKPFLQDANTRMRANVAVILSRQEDPLAEKTLEEMVRSENSQEKVGAIYSMGELRDKKHVPILLEYLNDPSFIIQRNVRDALCKYGIMVQGILLKDVRTVRNHQFILGAIQILREVGDRKALKTLLKLRESGDGEVRALAEEAMDAIVTRVPRG